MPDTTKKTKNSPAKIAANSRYNKRKYDHLSIIVPRGDKAKIQAAAQAAGESVNKYITTAVNQRMDNGNDSHKG